MSDSDDGWSEVAPWPALPLEPQAKWITTSPPTSVDPPILWVRCRCGFVESGPDHDAVAAAGNEHYLTTHGW